MQKWLICLLHILEMWIIRAAVNLSFKGVIMHARVFHRLDICSLVQRFILNRHIYTLQLYLFVSKVTLLHPCVQYFSLLIYKLISSNNSVTWDCYSLYSSKWSATIWDREVETSLAQYALCQWHTQSKELADGRLEWFIR
jgi:hypothetical protein